jgi:hypothetical protein
MHPRAKARLIVCVLAAASLGIGLASCSGDDSADSLSLGGGDAGDATKNDEPLLDSTAPAEESSVSTNAGADADARANADVYGGRESSSDFNADSAAEAEAASEAGSDSGSDADSAAEGDGQSASDVLVDGGDSGDGSDGSGAGFEAGPDAGVDTLGIIRATQGNLCADCAAAMCLNGADGGTACEGFASSVADGGSAAGESKTQLCYATLACILNTTTACYDLGTGANGCYCGLTAVPQCQSSGPGSDDAPCTSQEQMGLETADPGTVFNRLYDPTFGAGRANALLICLGNNCGDCLP